MNKRVLLLGGLALCAHMHSWALGRGLDPNQVPVIDPISERVTEVWRLAGFTSVGVSSVQIAPDWILTSQHATPSADSNFTNGFGEAKVAGCFRYISQISADLSLCKLRAKIAVPSNFVFPELVESPATLAGDRPLATISNKVGYFLTVGHGLPHLGLPRYVWSDLLSFPIDSGNMPGPMGLNSPAPYFAGGDSGSPVFWFSGQQNKIGLVGLAVSANVAGPYGLQHGNVNSGTQFFSADILGWIAETLNFEVGNTVSTSSAAAFVGAFQPTPSWLGARVLNVAGSTSTSIKLDWSKAVISQDTRNFTAFVQQQGGAIVRVASAAGSVRAVAIGGLTTNVPYVACVLPNGAGGTAPVGSATLLKSGEPTSASWDFSASCVPFVLNRAPPAVSDLNMKVSKRRYSRSDFHPTETITWSRPSYPEGSVQINYKVEVTYDGSTMYSVEQEGLIAQGSPLYTSGIKICAKVTPFTLPKTFGPVSEKCIISP